MDNESRRMLWRAHPRFGLVDRVYLFTGPLGIGLLLVDWRIGLAVLLVVVPVLFMWKQNELRRVLDAELGGREPSGRTSGLLGDDEFAKAQAAGAKAESSFNQAEVQLGWAVWSEVPGATRGGSLHCRQPVPLPHRERIRASRKGRYRVHHI
jgi:hypothetical protein